MTNNAILDTINANLPADSTIVVTHDMEAALLRYGHDWEGLYVYLDEVQSTMEGDVLELLAGRG